MPNDDVIVKITTEVASPHTGVYDNFVLLLTVLLVSGFTFAVAYKKSR